MRLKAADRPWYFKLAAFDLEGLIDLNQAKLLGQVPESKEPKGPPAGGPNTQGTDDGGPVGAPAAGTDSAPEPAAGVSDEGDETPPDQEEATGADDEDQSAPGPDAEQLPAEPDTGQPSTAPTPEPAR